MNMHRVTAFKIRNDIICDYPYFITEIKDQDQTNTRMIGKEFSILSVIKLLECLSEGNLSFQKFYLSSGFGMKRSFLNYLNLCLHFKFIEKEQQGHRVYYRLREKGKVFLDLFKHDNSN